MRLKIAQLVFKEKNMEIDEICEKLDDLAIRNLELCNDLIKVKLDLENRMKEGWFHLAKSRYLMGFNCVSGLQIDERKNGRALAQVDVSSNEIDGPRKFEVHVDEDKEKLRELTKVFGLLTPANVKSSQVQFATCLQLVGELASINEELKFVENEFEKYSKLKQKCLSQNEN